MVLTTRKTESSVRVVARFRPSFGDETKCSCNKYSWCVYLCAIARIHQRDLSFCSKRKPSSFYFRRHLMINGHEWVQVSYFIEKHMVIAWKSAQRIVVLQVASWKFHLPRYPEAFRVDTRRGRIESTDSTVTFDLGEVLLNKHENVWGYSGVFQIWDISK